MSRPANASGIEAAWIGVGWSYFRYLHALQSSGMILRDSKVVEEVSGVDIEGSEVSGIII